MKTRALYTLFGKQSEYHEISRELLKLAGNASQDAWADLLGRWLINTKIWVSFIANNEVSVVRMLKL